MATIFYEGLGIKMLNEDVVKALSYDDLQDVALKLQVMLIRSVTPELRAFVHSIIQCVDDEIDRRESIMKEVKK